MRAANPRKTPGIFEPPRRISVADLPCATSFLVRERLIEETKAHVLVRLFGFWLLFLGGSSTTSASSSRRSGSTTTTTRGNAG